MRDLTSLSARSLQKSEVKTPHCAVGGARKGLWKCAYVVSKRRPIIIQGLSCRVRIHHVP